MRKINLYNSTGQKLTEVNVRIEESEILECVMWGDKLFVFDHKMLIFKEANIYPAIIG